MKNLILLLLLVLSLNINAQAPQGYYDPAAGKYGTALKQALHDIIDNHTVLSYDFLITAFETTDKKSNGKVWDMYSDIPGGTPPYEYSFNNNDECGSYNGEGDCYNREHSWPKSWFSDKTPMYSDLFHLYPTDGYVNNRRSNYPFGKVGSTDWTSDNGSKVGDCSTPGYSGTVFEPIDAYKGDFARSYFYMSTRYFNEDNGWAGSGMTNGSQLKPWAVTMLMQWHQADPVSQKEIDRNNAVYAYQHNRNPYIDHPEFVNNVWAGNAGFLDPVQSIPLNAYPNPCFGNLTIELPSAFSKHIPDLVVYSATGGKVSPAEKISGNKLEINFDHQKAGLYILKLVDPETSLVYTSRIILE
ncbi:MAG: endonuclease [Bacteroidales bacterium]|nr:endonuclease [Bacteroidales bacterium]